jgi:anti-sigma factor RsiW
MNAACEHFVPLILRSADGTLAPGERAELDAHVASCADCRDALRDQSVVRQLLGAVEMPTAPRDFASRVRARVAPQPGLMDLLNWRAWTLRLAPVAALLALLAWYPANTIFGSTSSEALPAIVDEWADTQAQVAGGVLINSTSDRDALLAAALGETTR